MTWLENHPRDKFLASTLAAAPVGVVVSGALLVERQLNGTSRFATN